MAFSKNDPRKGLELKMGMVLGVSATHFIEGHFPGRIGQQSIVGNGKSGSVGYNNMWIARRTQEDRNLARMNQGGFSVSVPALCLLHILTKGQGWGDFVK